MNDSGTPRPFSVRNFLRGTAQKVSPPAWVNGASAAALIIAATAVETALAKPPVDTPLSRDQDSSTWVDANQLDMAVTNYGSFAFDAAQAEPGLLFPNGTDKPCFFAAGLWIGAEVFGDGTPRVTVSEFSSEWIGGTIAPDGSWDPNWQSNPEFRVYKIQPGDTPESNDDYAEWPVDDGAPVDENGNPRHLGDQTCWAVYHDADPNAHNNDSGNTAPLGLEVQQTSFARLDNNAAKSVIFLEWTILNKGEENLDNVYVAAWCDPDLGYCCDDLTGCDIDRNLGYVYNASDSDNVYVTQPPAAGIQLIQGPIVPAAGQEAYVSGERIPDYRNLPMTAFLRFLNGTDPESAVETYNYMQGSNVDGSPILDEVTGDPTTYMVSGDPVTMNGWLDSNPADRRMMISSGPFDMVPGDVQVVAVAIVVGQGSDRLDSIVRLRENADETVDLFRAIVEGADGACCLDDGDCLVTGEADCDGTFLIGQACDPDPCTPMGACCLRSGVCVLRTMDDCDGDYLGESTACNPVPCPIPLVGACCLGTSCRMSFAGECEGEFQGVGTVCTPSACSGTAWEWEPEPRWLSWVDWGGSTFNGGVGLGFEFFGSELERHEIENIEIVFTDDESMWSECQTYRRDEGYVAGGIGLFPGSAWDISDPLRPRRININFVEYDTPEKPADRMWNPDNSSLGGREYFFFMKSSYDGGATYEGQSGFDGALDSDVMWGGWTRLRGNRPLLETVPAYLRFYLNQEGESYGACCDADGDCSIVLREECDGFFAGAGSECDPNPCPSAIGACCLPLGHCKILGAQACPGDYLGDDTTCDPNPCPQPGACCTSDGRCIVVDGLACAEDYFGDGTTCEPNPCPAVGACCQPDGDCELRYPRGCRGEYLGDGTLCDPDPCLPTPAGVFGNELVVLSETNPFSDRLTIEFQVPWSAEVEVALFDVRGKEVRRETFARSAGLYELTWEFRGGAGEDLPTGTYFLRVTAKDENGGGSQATSRKLIRIR